MPSSSFYTDGGIYDEDVVENNDTPGSTLPSRSPSGFYPNGGVYAALQDGDQTLAAMDADVAASQAAAAAAASASASAAASLAAMTPSGSMPLMDGTATVGVSTNYARGDHKHPTDTSRAPVASPTFTGTMTSSGPASFGSTISAQAKGHLLGSAAGTSALGAVTQADANFILYSGSVDNWAGVGVDTTGNMWFRTGLTGPKLPAFYIDTAQNAFFGSNLRATDIYAIRGSATGALFFGSTGSQYIFLSAGVFSVTGGKVDVPDATASTTSTTGSITTAGGIGAGGRINAGGVITSASKVTSSAPAGTEHFSTAAGAGLTVANGANAIIANAVYGLMYICETAATGVGAVFMFSNGSTTLISSTGSFMVGSAPAVGQIGVVWDPASVAYRVYNNRGGTSTFKTCFISAA